MDKKIFFTVEYPGAETKKGPELKLIPAGVYLHFLRYGYFRKENEYREVFYHDVTLYKSKSDKASVINGEKLYDLDGIELSPNMPPFLEYFDLVRTVLDEGYLYLINDDPNAEDAFREVQVDSLGRLNYIIEKGSRKEVYKDKRGTFRDDNYQFLVVQPNTKYWIAFSLYQWDYKYLKEMLTNEEKRKERMQLVECKKIIPEEDHFTNHIKSYKNIKASFLPLDKREKSFEEKLKIIEIDEKNQTKFKGKNNLYEDLFITLSDPISCAFDMGIALHKAHTRHRALIESLKTGEQQYDAFKRLWNEDIDNAIPYNTDQFQALFGTALSLYHLFYSEPSIDYLPKDKKEAAEEQQKKLKKLKKHICYEKIENVLGIESRKQHRQQIENIRKDYCTFLNTDYFKKHLNCFTEDLCYYFIGKYILSDLIALLAEHPHDKDRYIDLPENYEGNNDTQVEKFFEENTQGDSIFHKIFMTPTPPEEIEKKEDFLTPNSNFKLSRAFIKNSLKITEGYFKYCKKIKSAKIAFDYVKALDAHGNKPVAFKFDQKELDFKLNKLNLRVEKDNFVSSSKKEKLQGRVRIKTDLPYSEAKAQALKGEVEIPVEHKNTPLLQRIVNNPELRVAIISLEFLNFCINVEKAFKDPNLKNITNSLGATALLGNSYYKLKEAFLATKKVDTAGVALIAKRLGALGSGINMVTSFWDSINSFKTRDFDASIAWGVAGVANSLLFVESLSSLGLLGSGTAITAATAFWPITIATVVSFAAVFLVIYLTDSPLEKFVKNNLLSDDNSFKYRIYKYTYVEQLIAQRQYLVDDEVAQWRDLKTAQDDLYDILCSYGISYKFYEVIDSKTEITWGQAIKNAIMIQAGTMKINYRCLKIIVTPSLYFYDISQFCYQMWFFPRGLQEVYTTDTKPILIKDEYANLVNKSNETQNTFFIEYNLQDAIQEEVSLDSLLIFINQMEIDVSRGLYWPSQRGKERYQAVKIIPFGNINNLAADISRKVDEDFLRNNIRIGTFEEIITPNTWKNEYF
jgi:hypothetical protein